MIPDWVRSVLRGATLIALLVGSAYLLRASGIAERLDQSWIDRDVLGKGIDGEVLFVALTATAMAVGLPRQVPAFLAGYAFGLPLGTVLALAASFAACVATFGYARFLGRHLLELRFGRRIQRIEQFLRHDTFRAALLVRLLPVGNNLLTNIAAGIADVRAAPFFAGSVLGYLPQTLIFALLGSGINLDPAVRISVGVVLFLASALLGVQLARRYRRDLADLQAG